MKLYEIDAAMQNILDSMVDVETGEVNDDALAMLEGLNAERQEKIENIALYYKNLSANAAAIKTEEEALRKRRQSTENHADSLKRFLSDFMPGEVLETARVKIGWRNTPAVYIQDEGQFIDWAASGHDELLSFKAPTVNKTAVKDAIKAGQMIEGAEIVTRASIQVR